ncbi:hypothetical protein [Rothia halotolerans]|uniref:hypothetical protein n=1 Tax=Rothia halotolerans TaxID=405770 RepID=UPI00101BAFF0|nr:hypothetical protein [Rothia halotolerans]
MTSNLPPGEPEGAAEPIRDPRPEGVRVPRSEGAAPAGCAAAPGIRWGRTAIALAGLLGLLGAALTAVLSPFTGIGWPLPVFLVIVGIGALASLRYLALSDREALRAGGTTSRSAAPASSSASAATASRPAVRAGEGTAGRASSRSASEARASGRSEATGRSASARTEAPERQAPSVSAPARAAGAPARPSARGSSAAPAAGRRASADVVAPASGALRSAPRRPTAATPQPRLYDRAPQAPTGESRGEAPRNGLAELRAQAKRSAARPSEAFRATGSTWDPVEVPKPTYVDAPEAHRERPEPLTPPAEPEAHSKSLEEASRRARPIDLDDVLSRRRA